MRVLVVSHYFWPEGFRINQVVEDLIAAGADVTVLTGHPSYPEGHTFPGYDARTTRAERHPAGYPIFRVPVVPRGDGGAVRLLLNYVSFVVTGILCGTWLLRGRKFDVVFVYANSPVIQGFVGVWFKWTKRARLVQWIQDLWPQALSATGFIKSEAALGIVRTAIRFMYRRSDLILGQSHAFVDYIRPDAGKVPVAFFPNPGEHPPADGQAPAAQLPTGKFNAVFGGNLGKVQAMETVVAAADLLRDHPDVHITLFGSGSMADWIQREVATRGLTNLTMGGRQPAEAMAGIYAQASALLLTLKDDLLLSQTVPSKLQSYFSTGVPIVAAVNGEAADIVRESGAGVACVAEDPRALADALLALQALPVADRTAMGAAGCRFFADHYKPDELSRRLMDYFTGTAGAGSRIEGKST